MKLQERTAKDISWAQSELKLVLEKNKRLKPYWQSSTLYFVAQTQWELKLFDDALQTTLQIGEQTIGRNWREYAEKNLLNAMRSKGKIAKAIEASEKFSGKTMDPVSRGIMLIFDSIGYIAIKLAQMFFGFFKGRPKKGIERQKKTLQELQIEEKRVRDIPQLESRLQRLGWLAHSYVLVGEPEHAVKCFKEAEVLAHKMKKSDEHLSSLYGGYISSIIAFLAGEDFVPSYF